MGIEADNSRNGMGPEIDMLIGTASVTAAPAIIPGVILIARGPGSNRNFTGGIIIARLTGMDPNCGPGVIGRSTGTIAPDASTGTIAPDASTGARTIPW